MAVVEMIRAGHDLVAGAGAARFRQLFGVFRKKRMLRAAGDREMRATQAAGVYVWEFDWVKLTLSWDDNRLSGASGKSHVAHAMGPDF